MSTRTRVALLLVLGVGLLCDPFYLWPHYADDAHELRASGPMVTADSATAIPLESLPSETATAVERAVETYETADDLPDNWLHEDQSSDHEWPRYESREAVPTEGLFESAGSVVAIGDAHYRYSIVEVDRSPPVLPELFRIPVGFAGALALTLGGLQAARGTVQLTTRAAWWLVGVWTAALLATAAVDGGFAGVAFTTIHEVPPVGLSLSPLAGVLLGTAVWILPAIGVVVGVGFRRKRWRESVGGPVELLIVLAFVAVTWPLALTGGALGFLLGQDRPS